MPRSPLVWDNVYGFDMSSIKPWAMREPLVDVVESKAVVGNEFVFKEIDIRTVRKEDLAFTAPFTVKLQRADYVHALLAYFTIDFAAPGMTKPVRFGTGPYDRYTHWKQTVFYLPKDVQGSVGDLIQGTLKCVPNARNPRDLDVSISYQHLNATGEVLDEPQVYEYHMC